MPAIRYRMIGLFFGSFNPIHNGHLAIARYLIDNGYCEEVWFVVSPMNPFKQDRSLLEESRRLDIVRAAIAGEPCMKACDIEFGMPRPSYTVDTLCKLSEEYKDKIKQGEKTGFALIIGGDNLRDFHLWKDYQKIAANHRIFVYPRPGIDVSGVNFPNVVLVQAPLFPVSSTEIREKVRKGEDIAPFVAEGTLTAICEAYKG